MRSQHGRHTRDIRVAERALGLGRQIRLGNVRCMVDKRILYSDTVSVSDSTKERQGARERGRGRNERSYLGPR